MKLRTMFVVVLTLLSTLPAIAGGKKKAQRAMIEKMEAVPCGAKEKGLTGLGSIFASVGITDVHSDEKLCPQYMLRTDDMEYHVRPLDHKHPVLLPVGQEGEFKIHKDILEMKIPDGDHKRRRYQVVAMKQIDHSESIENANYNTSRHSYAEKSDRARQDRTMTNQPEKPNNIPQ
ncbi:MAG TPA: hypothetical protein VFO39_01485 [Candidatus Sulfotelmatobacter sp.]|nr:hypothetical protein [Candidatus Sulfotelmatobacter sp.]